jgi:hypothetical protein
MHLQHQTELPTTNETRHFCDLGNINYIPSQWKNAHNFTTISAQINQVPHKDELSDIKNMLFFI